MISLDDLSLGDLSDPRTRLIAEMLAQKYHFPNEVGAAIQAGGLSPWIYPLAVAKLAWDTAVPDAVRERKLDALLAPVVRDDPVFGEDLERRLRELTGPAGAGGWYPCGDPYHCGFVGPGASRAVIDRERFRAGLRSLAAEDYRVLVVSGPPGSGKTHSWRLIDHLRQAGMLVGHKCVRVSTHIWGTDEVTGEMVAQAVADRLGLDIRLTGSAELADARARKILDMLVGRYPVDGVIRWIVLDGLDRPRVHDSARDVGRQLITMVDDGELPNTRLVITGFDGSLTAVSASVLTDQIPAIDAALLRSFLADVAARLGHAVADAELAVLAEEVLGAGGSPSVMADVEAAVVRLVKREWAPGGQHVG
ncbi:MAG TPA: hypothetical protein VH594_01455 [Trebonia sp.]|jgi:hypothetical protein